MKTYIPKSVLPAWLFDPATTRQLKLLRFFGTDNSQSLTKGVCSGKIGRLFADPANKHLWAAYVFTTGDEDDTSTDLQPHDRAALASVRIPDDWRPKRDAGTPSAARKALEELIADTLRDGSPFDDPLPEVTFAGKTFCFTGEFEFGTRKQCQEAVLARGGLVSKGITRGTDFLVIANDASPRWAHGGYGNKIEGAMFSSSSIASPSSFQNFTGERFSMNRPEMSNNALRRTAPGVTACAPQSMSLGLATTASCAS